MTRDGVTMRTVLGSVATAVALVVAGCGGDGGPAGDVEAYCRLSDETRQSGDFPTAEEFEALRVAAPAEIRGDVGTLVEALEGIEDPEDPSALEIFEDEEFVQASENIQSFDTENCGAVDGGQEAATSTEAADTTTTEPADTTTTGDDEGSAGEDDTLCNVVSDEEVSSAVGEDLSSADTFLNDENTCSYESEDHAYRLFIGRTPDLGQTQDFFLQTGEQNVEVFEEIEAIGDAAYFGVFDGGSAFATALSGGFVSTASLDVPSDDDAGNYRDALVDLLERIVDG